MKGFPYFHTPILKTPAFIPLCIRVESIIVLFLFIIVTANTGCSKDELLTARGSVEDSGPLSAGFCGWVIAVGSDNYQPDNLPLDFQVDGLAVEITYRIVRTPADCPQTHNYTAVIHLNRIERI